MEVGRCELVLHVRPCEGLMRQLDGTVEKRFAKKEILYPLQVLLKAVVPELTILHQCRFACCFSLCSSRHSSAFES